MMSLSARFIMIQSVQFHNYRLTVYKIAETL